MDSRSQKEREEGETNEEEEEEEKEEVKGEKEENKILQHSVTNISGYIPTFLSRNHLDKSNSCVEIMHMV